MDLDALLGQSRSFIFSAWREGVFGLPYIDILIAIAILSTGLLLRGLLASWLIGIARRAAPKRAAVFDVLAEPLRAIVLVFAVDLALRILPLDADAQALADRFVRSIMAAAVFWALARLAGAARTELAPLARILTPAAADWLIKALQLLFMTVGAAAVLEIWGVEVAPLLAGLGIFGVAIALGAQDLFKNLIAGLAVLAEKRFAAGDWISVDGVVEGTVEEINFRSTLVRRFDLSPVYVPNSQLADNAVTNFSRMTYRRIFWTIGVEYKSTVPQLRTIRGRIEDYLMSQEEFVKPPEASMFVRVDKFGDSAIEIMLYCFTRTTVWAEWLAQKEDLLLAIKGIVEEEGAAFAFPSRTIYFDHHSVEAPPQDLAQQADTNT
jgi:MscS family membrane protein